MHLSASDFKQNNTKHSKNKCSGGNEQPSFLSAVILQTDYFPFH